VVAARAGRRKKDGGPTAARVEGVGALSRTRLTRVQPLATRAIRCGGRAAGVVAAP
jgi:hypothetical protein